jgi:hypothetical protein
MEYMVLRLRNKLKVLLDKLRVSGNIVFKLLLKSLSKELKEVVFLSDSF